jgi:hypothetical protein
VNLGMPCLELRLWRAQAAGRHVQNQQSAYADHDRGGNALTTCSYAAAFSSEA